MGKVLLRALGWGLVGFIALPLLVLAIMLVVYQMDPRCGSAGDSGGCEMGIATMVMASAPVGAVIFFFVTLLRGAARRPPATK